jgi:hypothetical protein
MPFKPANRLSNGRPAGSKNTAPSKEALHSLINLVLSDLKHDYNKLSNSDKIKILTAFKHVFFNKADLEAMQEIHFEFNIK